MRQLAIAAALPQQDVAAVQQLRGRTERDAARLRSAAAALTVAEALCSAPDAPANPGPAEFGAVLGLARGSLSRCEVLA